MNTLLWSFVAACGGYGIARFFGRRTRMSITFLLLFILVLLVLAGCATERPPPEPKPTDSVCGGTLDGSYLFINCRRIYP